MSWLTLAASVAGTSHQARNTPCQDAHRLRTYGPAGEWLAVVVADGAGSASHSEAGANWVCDEFICRIEAVEPESLNGRDGMTALFSDVRSSLIAEAERLAIRPREMACTTLVAIIGPTSAMIAQLGDGAVILGDEQGYRVAFWPEPAEYANATDFLTEERFADALRFEAVLAPISEVAVFTDGLQRLALEFATRTPHSAFFRPLFEALRHAEDPESLAEPLRAFLDSPRVNERTDDDKTLVLALRHP